MGKAWQGIDTRTRDMKAEGGDSASERFNLEFRKKNRKEMGQLIK